MLETYINNPKRDALMPCLQATAFYTQFLQTGDESYIFQGLETIHQAIQTENADIYTLCLYTLLALEVDPKIAKKCFSQLRPFESFFKNKSGTEYILYLYCTFRLSQDHLLFNQGDKYLKLVENEINTQMSGIHSVIMADISFRAGDIEKTANWLQDAHFRGDRSPFLFYLLEKLFRETAPFQASVPLFLPFLRWALATNLPLALYMEANKALALNLFRFDSDLFIQIYERSQIPWVLLTICEYFTMHLNISAPALLHYKACVRLQLDTPQINEFLIRSAAENNDENFNRYSLGVYLETYDNQVEEELKPFIYHLVITNPDFSLFYKKLQHDITNFTTKSLDNRLIGRFYNSLYLHFIIENKDTKDSLAASEVKRAFQLLKESLFKIRLYISEPAAKWLWIAEPEKNQMEKYHIINQKATISAMSLQFTHFIFSADNDIIENVLIKRERLVENIDVELVYLLYEQGETSTDMLIFLSRHIKEKNHLSPVDIEILEKTVALSSIVPSFHMELMATLGFYYAERKNYAKALHFYDNLEDNQISPKHVDYMLLTYIKEKKIQLAVQTLQRKSQWISDKNVFYALKEIIKEPIYHQDIAPMAYEMLLKNRYDREFLQIVLQSYHGSLREWQNLHQSLSSMQMVEKEVDEIILTNAIYTNTLNSDIEKLFIRLADFNVTDPLVLEFTIFLSYKILIENLVPLSQTIYAMEEELKHITDSSDLLIISIALCHLYIENSIWTHRKNEIMKLSTHLLEQSGVLLPIFKKIKDKSYLTAYIEKNQPFLYRTTKDKRVSLYYKPVGEATYYQVPMKYLRFGIFTANIPVFFGEEILYFIREAMSTGSIDTKEMRFIQAEMDYKEGNGDDLYYAINNALIFEQMFQYEKVEDNIKILLEPKTLVSQIIIDEKP